MSNITNLIMVHASLLITLGFYLASVLVFAIALLRAPQGYEDRSGFHFGMLPKRVMFARRRPGSAKRN
jgi:hypothetical protein